MYTARSGGRGAGRGDRHRLAHPTKPRRARRPRADCDSCGYRSQRRNLGRGLPAAPADLRLGDQPREQRERQSRLPARRRRHRRRRERNRPALPDIEARTRAGGRQALGARLVRQRRVRRSRPQHDSYRSDRAHRSAAGRRFADLRLRRHRRRGQRHHEVGFRRLRVRDEPGHVRRGRRLHAGLQPVVGLERRQEQHVPQRRLFAPGSRVLGRPRPVALRALRRVNLQFRRQLRHSAGPLHVPRSARRFRRRR